MEEYKEMYFKLFGAVEDAIAVLIEVQQQCERMYIEQEDKTDNG